MSPTAPAHNWRSVLDHYDGNTHEDNINTLRANNVTLGCNPALYCPNDSVRCEHMAAFIHRALG